MNIHFLKQRAESFWRDAKFAISEKRWNSAAFHLEQVCQLYLKYYFWLKSRRYPKTHSLENLLRGVGKLYKKEKEVQKIIDENISVIGDLEQAYITARYLPVEFTQKRVENMAKFTKKLISFLKKL